MVELAPRVIAAELVAPEPTELAPTNDLVARLRDLSVAQDAPAVDNPDGLDVADDEDDELDEAELAPPRSPVPDSAGVKTTLPFAGAPPPEASLDPVAPREDARVMTTTLEFAGAPQVTLPSSIFSSAPTIIPPQVPSGAVVSHVIETSPSRGHASMGYDQISMSPAAPHAALDQQLAMGSSADLLDGKTPPSFNTGETPIPGAPGTDGIPSQPRRLGNFEIIRSIGSGGMAEVFLARREGLGGFERHVALKCIHPHLNRESHFVTMFLDEARLAAKIHDPRVVQIYELGEANGTYFIAMEYLAGESLSALIRKGLGGGFVLPPHLAARIVADVAGGLHAAHELRDAHGQPLEVVHRDMSHGNVIVLYSGGVKVLDFGVAKARNSLTTTNAGERKGKYGYMSPEQIRGEVLDRRSDVFSLGVVLWETLTRKRLFAADSEPATMRRVLDGEPPAPSTMAPAVPAELDQIVLRALAKDRRERFQTAEQMSVALEAYLHHAQIAATASDVAAFMRTAFADRIEAKNPQRAPRTGESDPLPLVELKQTQTNLTNAQELGRTRMRWLLVGLAGSLLLAGVFFGGRLSRSAPAEPTKRPVVAAVTVDAGPPPSVAAEKSLIDAKLETADIAIRNGRIASPPGDNALEMLIDIEALDPSNAKAAALRVQAIDQLLTDAQRLWDVGKQDSARYIYEDVLLFDPKNAVALQRRKSTEPRPVPRTVADVAIANPDQIPWLVSQIDLAIIERRLITPAGRNALEYLQQLRKLDPTNQVGARLGTEVASALTTEAAKQPDKKDDLIAAAKIANGTTKAPPVGPGSAAKPEDHQDKVRDAKVAAEWIQKGQQQLGSGHLAEARRAFEKAIVADSAAHGALAGLAEVAYNESDYTRAVLAAKRAVMLAPFATSYRMSLAKSYYKLLRYDDAIKQWKKVIEIDAKSPSAGSAQKNIEMAQRKMGTQ